jgi:hypothetical protein
LVVLYIDVPLIPLTTKRTKDSDTVIF